jgi:hypothetical protein
VLHPLHLPVGRPCMINITQMSCYSSLWYVVELVAAVPRGS